MNKLKFLIVLASIESIAAINMAAAYENELNVLQVLIESTAAADHNEPNDTAMPLLAEKSKQVRAEVVHTGIAALPNASGSTEKTALEKIMSKFRNLKIPSARAQKTTAATKATTPEPNIAESQPQDGNTSSLGQIDGKTLEELTALAKEPNAVAEPLALAQTLSHAGYSKEAAIFYEIAASRTTAMGRTLITDDKAWILLQLAACHRDAPETAIGVLDKLIVDYPKSIWTSAALARRDVLQWYQKDKPRSLLETGHE